MNLYVNMLAPDLVNLRRLQHCPAFGQTNMQEVVDFLAECSERNGGTFRADSELSFPLDVDIILIQSVKHITLKAHYVQDRTEI